MPTKTFNDRLTPEDKKEIELWDKFLRDDNKAFANANRRNRYHKLESLDENISLDGRETNKYEVTKGDSPSGEEVYLTNELIDSVVNFIGNLKEVDQIIMIYKLTDKPMSSAKLAKITGLSDKTVTARFKKYQKVLQQLLKDYI
ncbi:hypothetical protein [Streptococcus cristatus]|uniref:hypothetical protein n=1 Tax=Streptococcus cristatus TaxID=45634 RepID=UPI0028CFE693|nr:hypothetical protein [Streptococcus cristatus]